MVTTRKNVVRYSVVAVAVVLVAVVVTVVAVLVTRNTDSNSNPDSTGSRVTDSLKFIVVEININEAVLFAKYKRLLPSKKQSLCLGERQNTAAVVSRHGNRASTDDYIEDLYPINNTQYWPYGSFHLTPNGRVEMYKLGARVRSLYDGFLNSTFHPEELHASSTYMDRMLMSGEAFLAGLYSPRGWQLWDTSLPWQPTPLYSDSPDKTIDLAVVECTRFNEDLNIAKEIFLKTYAANITELTRIYNNATAANVTAEEAASVLYFLWDKLISEDTEGYSIPEWTKELYPQPLQNLIAQEYIAYYAGTDDMARLLIGSLFDEVLDVMKSVINGSETERKVQYYSGHDCSIVALQLVIGVPKAAIMGMVKPASALILEVHQDAITGQFTVQTVYIDGSSPDLAVSNITMSGCGDPCVFDSLVNVSLPYTGVHYDVECKNTSSYFSGRSRENLHLQHFL